MLGCFYNFWRKRFGGQVLKTHMAAQSYRKTFPKLNMNSILIFCIRPADSHNQRVCFCPGEHLYSIGYRVSRTKELSHFYSFNKEISIRSAFRKGFNAMYSWGLLTFCYRNIRLLSVSLLYKSSVFFLPVAILSSVLRTLRLHSPVDIVVCIYMNMLRLHSPVDIVVCWKFFFFSIWIWINSSNK